MVIQLGIHEMSETNFVKKLCERRICIFSRAVLLLWRGCKEKECSLLCIRSGAHKNIAKSDQEHAAYCLKTKTAHKDSASKCAYGERVKTSVICKIKRQISGKHHGGCTACGDGTRE